MKCPWHNFLSNLFRWSPWRKISGWHGLSICYKWNQSKLSIFEKKGEIQSITKPGVSITWGKTAVTTLPCESPFFALRAQKKRTKLWPCILWLRREKREEQKRKRIEPVNIHATNKVMSGNLAYSISNHTWCFCTKKIQEHRGRRNKKIFIEQIPHPNLHLAKQQPHQSKLKVHWVEELLWQYEQLKYGECVNS